MCNENKTQPKKIADEYRFLDYRLTQLETNLRKGQEKLEREQSQNYKELIKMLQIMQESSNEQNKTIIELNQRIITIETTMKCIDKLKEYTTTHHNEIKNINRRLNIYKVALSGIAVTVIGAAALHAIGMV